MYFNVIRDLIDEDTHYIFKNGDMVIYEGYELPEWLNDLMIFKISGTEDSYGEGLIFECINPLI